MICRKCGELIEDGASFCTNCGEKIQPVQENAVNSGSFYSENAENRNEAYQNDGAYQNQGYYSQENNPYTQNNPPYSQGNPGYWYPPVNDKAASVKDYLKWMLLYPLWSFVPGIGFIIYIVVCFKCAFDDSFKARANFFKAVLIAHAISFGFAILFFIIMFTVFGSLVATGMDTFEEMYPELFEEFEAGYNALRVFLGR